MIVLRLDLHVFIQVDNPSVNGSMASQTVTTLSVRFGRRLLHKIWFQNLDYGDFRGFTRYDRVYISY